jgi:predicted nucleic acid-binding protein
VIYLDSCALVKLIREEDESAALQEWLDERADVPVVTSELAHAEVPRVVRRNNHTDQGIVIDPTELALDLAEADQVLAAVGQLTVDRDLLVGAGALEEPMIRTLDAIHLASALELDVPELEFVAYDRRLAAAAHNAGLRVTAPR